MNTATPTRACFQCGTRTDGDDCPDCGGMTAEIISEYTDHQALEDGVLVSVTDRDRCTRTLFEDLARLLPQGQPPDHWPVDIMTWSFDEGDGPTRAISACKGLIARDSHNVGSAEPLRLFYEVRNVERDRVAVPVITKLTPLGGVEAVEETQAITVIWVMRNELGGVTMMYPSDY